MQAAATPAASSPPLSPLARVVAIFTRPAQAWGGLQRVQWWIPLLITLVITATGNFFLHDRALMPMLVDQWEQEVADGNMPAEQMERAQAFMEGTTGKIMVLVQQAVLLPVFTLFAALLIWFGVGFVLGSKISYRLALEVAAWAGLISLPGYFITFALAWFKETMKGIHTGFGLLLPDTETPGKLMTGVGAFLDGIGPLALWYVAVVVLGAAALSGAPRKSVMWVLGGLYLVIMVLIACMAAMGARG